MVKSDLAIGSSTQCVRESVLIKALVFSFCCELRNAGCPHKYRNDHLTIKNLEEIFNIEFAIITLRNKDEINNHFLYYPARNVKLYNEISY